AKNSPEDNSPKGTNSRSIIGNTTWPPPKTRDPTLKNTSKILSKALLNVLFKIGNTINKLINMTKEVMPILFDIFTENFLIFTSSLFLKYCNQNKPDITINKIYIQ